MKLEHISAVLRPRSDAEAVDFGLAMVRRHAAGLYKAWFTLLIPLWGTLLVLLHNYPSVMVFIAWWLKPLYDRVILFYLGRALFGAAPTLREQVREWPRLLSRRLGLSLLWGRLSGARSFTMPVVVLEGLEGKLYKERTAILKHHGGPSAFGFMQLFLLLELAVIIGFWIGIKPWLPEEYTEWFELVGSSLRYSTFPPAGLMWSVAACYLTAVALLEPFYAGGGFGQYINSRTHLEGWDVDLAFRQLGTRLRARQTALTAPPPLVLLAAALLLGLGSPAPVAAANVDPVGAKAQIKEVLTHPDFTENVKKYQTWEWDPSPAGPKRTEPEGWDWSWLGSIGNGIARFFSGDWKELLPRLLLAIGFVALVAWLATLLWKHRRSLAPRGPKREKDRGPRVVMGMEVTPESLPPDIPSSAWAAAEAGQSAAAIRLLYRGALAWLMDQGGVSVRESDTEGDCLRHAGTLPDPGQRRYFADLTGAWLTTAYGKSPPPAELLRGLCTNWPFALTTASDAPARSTRPGLTSLVLLVAALSLTGCRGKWVDREVEIGYLGEAKRNPWLAATRFLELNNIPVLQQRGLANLPDEQSVIILTPEAIRSEALSRRVLDWTRRGGHLIYLAEGGEPYRNDWNDSGSSRPMREGKHPLLAALNITQSEIPGSVTNVAEVRINRQTFKISLKEEIRFDLTASNKNVVFSAGNHSESVLASLRHGSGRVTLVSHASAFRSRWIDNDDHAALLLALVRQTDPVFSVTFIKAGTISLPGMLLEYAWPALAALALLLVFWLWRVLPRFGPVRALPRRSERRFATHLDEAGTFLWKQHLSDSLLEAPRQAVLSAARHHGLREEERLFTALLATRAGLPPERVQDALFSGNQTDAKHFTRSMADLQSLLAALQFNRPPA